MLDKVNVVLPRLHLDPQSDMAPAGMLLTEVWLGGSSTSSSSCKSSCGGVCSDFSLRLRNSPSSWNICPRFIGLMLDKVNVVLPRLHLDPQSDMAPAGMLLTASCKSSCGGVCSDFSLRLRNSPSSWNICPLSSW
jgi:hypothetical protein